MIKQEIVASSHAAFAPSSAKRIMVCPASFLRTKDLPDQSSYEAAEGTVAHEIHEHCLNTKVKAQAFVGKVYEVVESDRTYSIECTHEMAAYVQDSVDYCQMDGEHFVEVRVDISRWTPIPDQKGTSDHGCIITDDLEDGETLVVTDLKFGIGVKVYAEKNPQLALYAGGMLEALPQKRKRRITNVVIRVSQPRLNHYDVWAISVAELYEFLDHVAERFVLAMDPNAPFKPEAEACQFCKLKPRCPALAEMTAELANSLFDDLTDERDNPSGDFDEPIFPPSSEGISTETQAKILEAAPTIIAFLKAVENDVTKSLLARRAVPQFKLVEGKSNRKWVDETGAMNYLAEHNVPLSKLRKAAPMISPAEAEKLVPAKERAGLRKFYTKPMGRPTLAPASDKRPAFDLSAAHLFDDITDDGLATGDDSL